MKVTIAVDGFLDEAHTPAMDHELDFVAYDDPVALSASLARADALVTRRVDVTDDLLAVAPRLKLVQQVGIGTDRIDLFAAAKRGVMVANTPGAVSRAVVEHAFLLILAVLRNLPAQFECMRSGGWSGAEEWRGEEIGGATLGLIGYGSIGEGIVQRALAFDANVLVTTRTRPTTAPSGVAFVDLPDLLGHSDIVVLAAGLNAQTRGMIGAAELRLMKPTAILVNIARGALVDEQALISALTDRRIHGAGLDAYLSEPPSGDSPFRSLPNVVATPHAAGSSRASRDRIWAQMAENLDRMSEGRPILNLVKTSDVSF